MFLHGRKAEAAELAGLVHNAESGLSAVRVIRGPAGIGKTALLEQVIANASGIRVMRVSGVEVEQELGFAGLHRLLLPLLGERGRLPGPQRDALETAFGMLAAPAPPDQFLVGLAALTLLAEAAAERPLLAVCDDAHWLDRESSQVLAFVARRLDAEAIVLLLGVRDDDPDPGLAGLPEMPLAGLSDPEAARLLETAGVAEVDHVIAMRLLSETDGNPLAILELARALGEGSPIQPGLRGHLPLDRRLEERFLRSTRALDTATQILLLVVAAAAEDDPDLIRRAFTTLSSTAFDIALEQAGRAELLVQETGSGALRFRHPLIRSAVYGGAPGMSRRQIHAALAEAADPIRDADRRAWHRAGAVENADAEVAAELEAAAARAGERGGHLAQAAFLRRAAELTPTGPERNARLLTAAGAALTAGAPHLAEQLLNKQTPDLGVAILDAYTMRLRGFLNVMLGRTGAVPLLFEAALGFRDFDVRAARDTLLEAFDAVIVVARIGSGMSARRIAETALETPRASETPTLADLLLEAHAELVGRDYVSAVPRLRQAQTAMLAEGAENGEAARWFLLGALLAIELWDVDVLGIAARRYAVAARGRGALRALQVATHGLATHAVLCGRLAVAAAYYAEFMDVATAIRADLRYAESSDALLHGWRGDEIRTLAAVRVQAGPDAERPGGLQVQIARTALVILRLGQCRYPEAQEAASVIFDEDPPHFGNIVLPDLIEAACRANDTRVAGQALRRLTERATASGTPWARAVLTRSQALCADGPAAEALYLEALSLLESTPLIPELARTRLLYGEWLRRRRRRRAARDQLRAAHETFLDMGATAFAERARAELSATGEEPRRRNPSTLYDLTARELQVANLAASGITNQQIAAELFLSTATVEYHLRKIFRKLGVTSRRELRHQL
ncbi:MULTISPECIES: LuxR family transcriptional regulator [Nocardia]|uniref:LuxR family transcriptional regulator n=1 Tax=Nocardia sputorum TaxID=2984338 RepID=A0ABN6TTS7_9NOCA|nr:LuxR family transcriptional regulator [Nocardia sputorum]BDT97020.1 LuxR family transcriptional regulator [Nocardia sputorum]